MGNPRRGPILIFLLGVLAGFPPASIDMVLPALPDITADLVTLESRTQWTVGAFLVGMCLGMVFHGPLSDRLGRRPVLVGGILLYIGASVACAVVDSVGLLIGARFLQALGGGAASVMARAIVRDIYSAAESPRILSLISLVTTLTPLLAPVVGAGLLHVLGWRAIFLALTLFGAATLIAVWRIIPESLAIEHRATGSPWRALAAYGPILAGRDSLGHLLTAGGVMGAMFAYITATPFIYIEYFGVSPLAYALLFGANICAQALGVYLNSRLVTAAGVMRINGFAVLSASLGAAGLLVAGLTGVGGLGLIVFSLPPIIGVTTVLTSNCTARMMALFPESAGTAAAALVITLFAMGGLASGLVSLLHDGTPFAMALVMAGFISLSAVGRFVLVRERSV